MGAVKRIRVLTYNIHRARGLDGQLRLDRIIDVLREVDADIVALQITWIFGAHPPHPYWAMR